MPLPIDTLLRVHASPVPAQIVFGACGSIAIAPMDCADSLSKTGLNVVPPFEDFQTPPLAAPTYTVSRPSSFTAAIAATRPLMAADPMFRAPSPEIVSESNFDSCAGAGPANIIAARITVITTAMRWFVLLISADSSSIESKLGFVDLKEFINIRSAGDSLPGGWRFHFRFGNRHREVRVFHLYVLFNLFDGKLRAR